LIRSKGGEWTYPVEAEETLIVSGPLGSTAIKLEKNSARIENSPCDNKTCAAAGAITKQGQWTACLPNNVLLIITGSRRQTRSEGGSDVDSVAW